MSNVATAASYWVRGAEPPASSSRWRSKSLSAFTRLAIRAAWTARMLARAASRSRKVLPRVCESISATNWPASTTSPISTARRSIRPVAWAPTRTSSSGSRTPVASTTSSMSPFCTCTVTSSGFAGGRRNKCQTASRPTRVAAARIRLLRVTYRVIEPWSVLLKIAGFLCHENYPSITGSCRRN